MPFPLRLQWTPKIPFHIDFNEESTGLIHKHFKKQNKRKQSNTTIQADKQNPAIY